MGVLRKRKKLQEKVKEVKEIYNDIEKEEEAVDEASNRVVEEIGNYKDSDRAAVYILKLIEENQDLPSEVLVDTIKKLLVTDQLDNPKEVTVKAAENLELNSKELKDISRVASENIGIAAAKDIAEQIPNDDIRKEEKERLEKLEQERRKREEREKKKAQEQKTLKELKKLYVHLSNDERNNLIDYLKNTLEKNDSQKVKDIVERISARLVAIDWKKLETSNMSELSKLIPPSQMLETNFPDMVAEEFEEVKDDRRYKGDRKYNKSSLEKMIFKEMAKNIARTYKKYGVIEIEHSKIMEQLDESQINDFANMINKYCGEGVNIERIKNEIRGIENDDIKDLEDMLAKIPEEKRTEYIRSLKEQVRRQIEGKGKVILAPELEDKLDEIKCGLKMIDFKDSAEILDKTLTDIDKKSRNKVYTGGTQGDDGSQR